MPFKPLTPNYFEVGGEKKENVQKGGIEEGISS